jgi:prepilin-type N-terminal cleavage/methylation domain-containing protein
MVNTAQPTKRTARGFTLVELSAALVVLGIVALVAISVSRQTGNRIRGIDGEVAIARVLSAEQAYASSRGAYTADPTQLAGIGRDITVITGASTASNIVSVAVLPDGALALASLGSDNECAGIWASNPLNGSTVNSHTWTTGTCAASSVPRP